MAIQEALLAEFETYSLDALKFALSECKRTIIYIALGLNKVPDVGWNFKYIDKLETLIAIKEKENEELNNQRQDNDTGTIS